MRNIVNILQDPDLILKSQCGFNMNKTKLARQYFLYYNKEVYMHIAKYIGILWDCTGGLPE